MPCKSDSRIQKDSLSVLCAMTCHPRRGAYSVSSLTLKLLPTTPSWELTEDVVLVVQSLILSNSYNSIWTITCQAPLSMGFFRQECQSGLPFPHPGDFPYPGIEPASPMSPSLAGGFFTTSTTWEALNTHESASLCYSYPSNGQQKGRVHKVECSPESNGQKKAGMVFCSHFTKLKCYLCFFEILLCY